MECDISENTFYCYSKVHPLFEKIEKLKSLLNITDDSKDNFISEHAMNSLKASTSKSTTPPLSKRLQSNEVGSLTSPNANNDQGKYIGAATGSNFAKMFLNQMYVQRLDEVDHLSSLNFSINDYSSNAFISNFCAPLPPYNITKLALNNYVNFIHIYFPILNLKDLLNSLNEIYKNPKSLTYHDKYVLFMVIAIGLEKGEIDSTLSNYYNQFKPIEFYNTAKRYLNKLLSNRSISTLQELLLLMIWQLNINILKDDNGDLWYLGRYIMALAIELNLNKLPSINENISASNFELRKRLFWSTFILERSNAVKFGRGLSIRMKDVEIDFPNFVDDDLMYDTSFYSYNRTNFTPCLISVELYEIYTLLLETIYISRTKGSKPKISDEEILNYKTQIQNLIEKTLDRIEKEFHNSLFCYHELKIKTLIASIILNRPSPSFLSPDLNSLLTCKENCLECLRSFKFLISTNWRSSPSNLHDLVNISLTMVFCCWRTETNSNLLRSFSADILVIMGDIIKFFPTFAKFRNLYIVISSIIVKWFDKNASNFENSTADGEMGLAICKEKSIKNNNISSDKEMIKESVNLISGISPKTIDISTKYNNLENRQESTKGKKRSYNEADLSSPFPVNSSQFQFHLQHYPMKYSEVQNFQYPQQLDRNIEYQITSNSDNTSEKESHRDISVISNNENIPFDISTHELLKNILRQYYVQETDVVKDDISHVFDFQNFNWA